MCYRNKYKNGYGYMGMDMGMRGMDVGMDMDRIWV
jgi:hypothetical protein